MPFVRLLEELRPGRAATHNELFPVGFLVQNAPVPAFDLPGLSLRPVEVENGTAKRDFILTVVEGEEEMTLGATFRTDVFDRATVRRLLAQYADVLEDFVTDPGRPLSAFR
jgi:non-ribosomal peptide synthetase component F